MSFPRDAWDWINRLGVEGEEPTRSWESAWDMAGRTCTHWSPRRHLIRYLASCEHRRITPSAVTWIRFLVDDEQKEAREIAVQVEMRLREKDNERTRDEMTPDSLRRWREQWVE